MTETQLIIALQNGEVTAFDVLVTSYQHLVYRTALNMLQHETDAEDVAQEVFVVVFRSVKGFKGASGLSTWLYRITINECLDWQRKKARKKRFAWLVPVDDEQGGKQAKQIPSADHHPDLSLEQKERAAILYAAVNKLPQQQKTAFLLAHAEQLSYAAIAAVMETTVGAIESLLVRARKNLKTMLAPYYYEDQLKHPNQQQEQ